MSSDTSRSPTRRRLAPVLLLCSSISSPVFGQQSAELEVLSLVDGALETASHTFEVDSLTLSVAENRSDTASRSIEIPVIRVRTLSETSGTPVFWLGGGPGQTNLRTFDFDYFIERHDHVMVGYRGVDGSTSQVRSSTQSEVETFEAVERTNRHEARSSIRPASCCARVRLR